MYYLGLVENSSEEELNAELSFKGKHSSFFIMNYVPGDTRDPTGQQRVPTSEQAVFIQKYYPKDSRPDKMINKIYQLFKDAFIHEQSKST